METKELTHSEQVAYKRWVESKILENEKALYEIDDLLRKMEMRLHRVESLLERMGRQ